VAPSTAEDILGADWRGRPDVVSRATGGHSLAVAIVILVAVVVVGTILTAHRRRSLPPPTGEPDRVPLIPEPPAGESLLVRRPRRGVRVVCLGGGTGLSTIL